MRLLRDNDVVRLCNGGPRWLLLAAGAAGGVALDLADTKSWPVAVCLDALEADVEAGRAVLDEHAGPRIRESDPTPTQLSRRDARWEMVEPIVTAVPDVYDPAKRFAMISDAAARCDRSLNTVRKAVQDFWRRGRTRNALLDDYDRSGAPGVQRSDPGEAKRGRPRFVAPGTGTNVNRAMRRVFDLALRRYYAINRKLSIRGAFAMMLRDQYAVPGEDGVSPMASAVWRPDVDPLTLPTFTQFDYHYRRYGDRLGLKLRRVGRIAYAKSMRALPSTAASEAWGPGSRFLIDATILDVYLRSRIDRRRIVGRPVLYVVIDVFSRMIVGIYVGIENACWVGAAMALANAAGSKVEFCAGLGIEIGEEDWPAAGFAARLESDKGEVDKAVSDCLIDWFGGLKVETAASRRPDLKGLVETQFGVLPAVFSPFVPGWVESDFAERGARDYRLDGVLDIDQLTRILVMAVLHRNNAVTLPKYDRPADMPAAEVPAVPNALWHWGVANRSGSVVQRPDWYVRFHLMPTGTAVVTDRGLRFMDCLYVSEGMLVRGWLDRARQEGVWKVDVSFDPRLADEVLLHVAGTERGHEVCRLADASRAYRGMSFREIGAERLDGRRSVAANGPRQTLSAINVATFAEAVVAEARAMLPHDDRSTAEIVRHIRDNRSREREADGVAAAGSAGPGGADRDGGVVVPMRPEPGLSVRERAVDHLLEEDDG